MFRSKVRDIVITQYEHGRLAGVMASLWGNEQFDKPPLDFAAFITGVTFHDWGYGPLDNQPLDDVAEAVWLETTEQGIEYYFADPAVDIIKTMHVRRLLTYNASPQREPLYERATARIKARLKETPHTMATFDWTDRITRFCDSVAFSFSFEQPTMGSYAIYPTQGDMQTEIEVTYAIRPDGEIAVAPWPFSQPRYEGFITGYQAAGYPDTLTPLLVPFSLRQLE